MLPNNEYSPMMPNNFVQNSQYDDIDSYVNSAIYGSSFQKQNNFRNKGTSMEPKPTKLKKANFRAKRQNIQKASKPFGDITEPTKQTKTSQIQKIEPIQKQIELILQKPTMSHTVESFNNLSLTDQLSTISNITDQSQQQMSIHSILSILHEMNPTGGSHFLSLQTKNNKMLLNVGISNIEQLNLSHSAIEQIITHQFPLDKLAILPQTQIELKYPSEQFESAYKQCLNHKKRKETHQIRISILISGINKTDMRFKNDTNIYSVKFDPTVTEISGGGFPIGMNGGGSFSCCSSLEEVTIPSSVNLIGNFSLSKCTSLTRIILPSSLTSIENGVFFGCSSLTEVTIPSSVKSIGSHCFNGCSKLHHISIPSEVTQIGPLCFNGCSSLNEIEIPSKLEVINANCFKDCSSLVRIIVPDSVKVISENAFNGCKELKEIQLSASLESIGEGAFSKCSSLTKCEIPDFVKFISDDVFNGCSSLTDLSLGSWIKSIGKGSFLGCQSLK